MKIYFLFFFSILPLNATAGSLAFTQVSDTTLNHHFWGLSNLQGLPNSPAKKEQLTEAIDALLTYMAPTIQASPGFQNPFFLNCTVYFNTQVEQINCDSNFDPADGLEPASDQRAFLLPRIKQLQRSHILWTQVYVDGSNGKYQNAKNQLYFRQSWDPTITEPESFSATPTSPVTPTTTVSSSKSATQTRTPT